MTSPQTKDDLLQELDHVRQGLIDTVQPMNPDQFSKSIQGGWSASEYLKHLLLSIKPLARALALPADQLSTTFGQAESPSRSYEEIVAMYKQRIDEGIRAEDYQVITPVAYRLPEDITPDKEQGYLLESWQETHQRMLKTIGNWSEAELDTYQLPHPAIGMITLREMLFFTLYHNTLHWEDIQGALR